jgi:hypothetical protein
MSTTRQFRFIAGFESRPKSEGKPRHFSMWMAKQRAGYPCGLNSYPGLSGCSAFLFLGVSFRVELFEQIRRAAKEVAERAKWVRLNEERLVSLADVLGDVPVDDGGEWSPGSSEGSPLPGTANPDPVHDGRADADSTLAFILTLDAVNFGSGWFPYLRKRPGQSGYFTIAGGLKDHFDRHGVLAPSALEEIQADECARIFDQPLELAPASELMDLFARSWRDLGALVNARFGGSFAELVKAADHRAESLVRILAEMPLYRDVEHYGDLEVPFYKRAQITCSDLATAFRGSNFGRFDDLDGLTIFADNLVPHVLRREGVLDYDPDLLRRIQAEELIVLGSTEEIEIRALAVYATERLSKLLTSRGRHVLPRHLDTVLWNRGQSGAMKSEPRHRTRCTYY